MSVVRTAAALLVIAATATATAGSAAVDPGYKVKYVAKGDKYCVIPRTEAEATRLAIPIFMQECHTSDAWSKLGIHIERR